MSPHDGQDGERAGVTFTHLDDELFAGSDATKRDLVNYLDAISDLMIGQLADRPLSVVRVRPGQPPFMQKNLPRYAPDFIQTVSVWAESSHRKITYALCNDRRTLLWFANQRAVEYHPTLTRAGHTDSPDFMVLDIDPPSEAGFGPVISAALLVREALADAGLSGAVKTSGSKGVHIVVPLAPGQQAADAAAATRAIAARAELLGPELATTAFIREDRGGKVFLDATRAGGATVAAAYSPRVRPGTTVSFPLEWTELPGAVPAEFTVRTAAGLLGGHDRWARLLPEPQQLPASLVAEGHQIPVARVAAMHEGKRRARSRRDSQDGS